MIWTLILSFNSSVWLHLTLYIAWEQSNIPQYSSMLACWDTLHLPAVIQGGKGWTEAKKSNSPTFSLLHLWVTIFNIPGGLQKVGEKFSSRLLSFPKVFPNSSNSSWDIWSWNLLKEKGFALLCWRSQVLLGGFLGISRICTTSLPIHLLFLPVVPRSSHPRKQLLEWGLTQKAGLVWFRTSSGWGLGPAQKKLLACFTSLPHPRGSSISPQQHQEKTGSFFLSLNFKPGHL